MRFVVSFVILGMLAASGVAADDPPVDKKKSAPSAKKKDSPLQVGENLPGAFHPFNVTGPNKQRFHSPVSERDLDPTVMIFYKSVDFSEPLPTLLKALDARIDSNPESRLTTFVIFLPDDLPEVVGGTDKTDDARRELEKKIEQASNDMKLKHVVLCLDSKDDVDKYGIREANLVTVVLYARLKVVEVVALPKSDFTSDAVQKIGTAVSEKLKVKIKESGRKGQKAGTKDRK